MYFVTTLLVLAGCNNKDNALNNAPEGTPFKKGQQVTLTIGTGNNANQVTPRKVAGIDNTTNNRIDFTWEEGDKILVKVGDQTAEFTLSSEPGSVYGEFAGTMPADGSTFDIQYPIYVPNITKQVYTTEKPIPADSMLFRATNCTLDAEATLLAQHAMVQFNLYGTDKTVGMIIFKNITVNPAVSDTLICTGGKTIGATAVEATPFYMVVPTGEYQFEAGIWDNATTPAEICSFATSAAKTFTAGECLNMPAKEVKEPFVPTYVDLGLPSGVKWATCNVGATKPEEYGDYFAWGETAPHPNNNYSWGSYKYCCNGDWTGMTKYTYPDNQESSIWYSWGSFIGDNKRTLELIDDAARVKWEGNWRMPTAEEFQELMDNCNHSWTTRNGVKGRLFTSKTNSDNYIFLPAAGFRDGSSLCEAVVNGFYWSSSLGTKTSAGGRYMCVLSAKVIMGNTYRYYGQSVRAVCE